MSAKLEKLYKLKSREFRKHRYSARYKELKKECDAEIKAIKKKRIDAAVADGSGSNSWLSKMEALLHPDGCSDKHSGILPEHREAGFSRAEQAQDYALHISKISRDYVPLTRAVLPDRVQFALDNVVCQGHPLLQEHEVFKLLSERKLTGGVQGDLDPRITKE